MGLNSFTLCCPVCFVRVCVSQEFFNYQSNHQLMVISLVLNVLFINGNLKGPLNIRLNCEKQPMSVV